MNVPFYENTDNTHCYQSVFRMILKYYWPHKEFSWEELEKITAKVEGLWTGPTAGMLWLYDNRFTIHKVRNFDYAKFIEKRGDYLVELLGKVVAKEQIAHSNLDQEVKYAKQIVEKELYESRIPELSELKKRLDEEYLLICNVNSGALNHKDRYAGHFILLTGYNNFGFVMHDPGPPGIKDREVKFADFEYAWAYPNENAQNYIAIKRSIES